MKTRLLKTSILLFLSCAALQADNLVTNGDFETGDGKAFYQTTGWYNQGVGFNQGTGARSDKGTVISGSYSATVHDRYNKSLEKFGAVAHVQKTQHTIEEGDSFSLSYEWRPADDYWQRSTDTIRFILFATADDKLSGPIVWSAEFNSPFFRGKITTPMGVSETTEVVTPDAVGKKLFICFHGLDTVNSETGSTHFASVDNIEVSATNNHPKKP